MSNNSAADSLLGDLFGLSRDGGRAGSALCMVIVSTIAITGLAASNMLEITAS